MKRLFATIFVFIVSAAASFAQNTPERSILSARDQFSDIKNRSVEMERMKRDAGKPSSDQNLPVKFPEIKEDFEKIQKINSDLLQKFVAATQDRTAIGEIASEINQRAARLKSNLFPAEPKTKNKRANADEPRDLITLLKALDESIDSFVHSSIFQSAKLVNSQDSLKAQQDLESVIKLSNAIKLKIKNQTSN